MAYLDVSPMIGALRTRPNDFAMNRDWLEHLPSRHGFQFDREGNVIVRAACDCAMLAVERNQSQELARAYEGWRTDHWVPQQINREFAAHFAPPSKFRAALIAVSAKLHAALLRWGHRRETGERLAALAPK